MALGSPDFDIGILGGGPAGSAMASYLAKAGVSCVVFERELFPRPHVGESLVPSSTRVFKELGFINTMQECNFPRKYGAAWTSEDGGKVYRDDFSGLAPDCVVDVAFSERHQDGVDLPYTWHVDRAKFDLALLQHANALGANVYEGINVRAVEFPSDDWVKIRYQIGARECGTTVRTVIDASGRRTIIGNQLNWKVMDPVFDQYALHTWFEGYDRMAVCDDPSKRDLIFIHFLPITNSWVWQIPITDDVTSIGVVTQKSNFKATRVNREQFFWDAIASRPEFSAAVRASSQMRPLKAEGDYSYAMKNICGDRVILIGDAARFVDPIFSTGVSIALNSARFASRDVLAAMEAGDFSRSSFANYESTLRRGTKNWHEFITVYYRLNVLFTAFIMDPRYRLDVLKLLQGDVYDEDAPAVLTKMKKIVSAVERDSNHVWHKLLGDLTANAFSPTF